MPSWYFICAAQPSMHHAQREVVLAEHVGLEATDTVVARRLREVLHEQGADSAFVVVVGDQQRHLRCISGQPFEGGDPDEPGARPGPSAPGGFGWPVGTAP